MSNELINGLLKVSKEKTLSQIEIELGMPKNNLSAILKGKRPFPPKWVEKVTEYLKKGEESNNNSQTGVLEAKIKELEAENRKLRSEIEGLKSAKIALKNDYVQVTNLTNDKNTNYSVNTVKKLSPLDEIRNSCPKELTGIDRTEWISKRRSELGV